MKVHRDTSKTLWSSGSCGTSHVEVGSTQSFCPAYCSQTSSFHSKHCQTLLVGSSLQCGSCLWRQVVLCWQNPLLHPTSALCIVTQLTITLYLWVHSSSKLILLPRAHVHLVPESQSRARASRQHKFLHRTQKVVRWVRDVVAIPTSYPASDGKICYHHDMKGETWPPFSSVQLFHLWREPKDHSWKEQVMAESGWTDKQIPWVTIADPFSKKVESEGLPIMCQ
jgi:hypothetical protein